jgi:fumarate hydratase class I
MTRLNIPISEEDIRALTVGDEVELYGTIVTARDAAHKIMVEEHPKIVRPVLNEGVIYHCGPVMKKTGKKWSVVAAGPTTSIREEPYEAQVMEDYNVRAVIGKGGMKERTLEACQRLGAVYLHAVGGAAVSIADSIKEVRDVYMLDKLGMPEAFWVLEVAGFKTIVTMDSRGQSLHETIYQQSKQQRDSLLGV